MRFIAAVLTLTLALFSPPHGVEGGRFSTFQNACIDQPSKDQITVHLENSSEFEKRWIVKDARTGRVVLNQTLEGGETVTVDLTASSAGYGEILYRHPGRSTWSRKSLISDGETVSLY